MILAYELTYLEEQEKSNANFSWQNYVSIISYNTNKNSHYLEINLFNFYKFQILQIDSGIAKSSNATRTFKEKVSWQ